MDAPILRPETSEERIIYYSILWTWGYWVLGALYIVGPVIGWYLAFVALSRYVGVSARPSGRLQRVPIGVVIWWVAMGVMLFALLAAHLNFGLGVGSLLKSSIGWAKGWALMAVFPLIGAMLPIRAEIVYRATNKLALQTLLLVPVFIIAALARAPTPLYVSPLQIFGGAGPQFFQVALYSIDETNGNLRWSFFAPWSPAAAFISNVSLVFALYDRSRLWKCVGVASCVTISVMSQSRLAIVAIPGVILLLAVFCNLTRPLTLGVASFVSTLGILFATPIMSLVDDFIERFTRARAASSKVRAILRSMALHRWESEAPIFGHGVLERGPHIVEHMPIGSHDSWYGLLFVKGIVGFAALAIPLAWTFLELLAKAQADRVARCALGVVIIIGFYSFGENLEILSYLFWPGLVVIGIAMRRRLFHPLRHRFAAPLATEPEERSTNKTHSPEPRLEA
ncbi:O-antigen ligase domain-containing protein [Methylocystis sp. FS]|uniref:O-antigen ligase family protein n=1 Tax=Methylocystis silviterrae TaxID=2743612 RepID=UPI00158218F9|nr:O-antigen ligase family protein [Methylocystis silviterrae]NUJ79145.1 O-antigen ligase domain-containing protein [Methylocystis silviterrae]